MPGCVALNWLIICCNSVSVLPDHMVCQVTLTTPPDVLVLPLFAVDAAGPPQAVRASKPALTAPIVSVDAPVSRPARPLNSLYFTRCSPLFLLACIKWRPCGPGSGPHGTRGARGDRPPAWDRWRCRAFPDDQLGLRARPR